MASNNKIAIRDRIWTDLVRYKFKHRYLCYMLDLQKHIRKATKVGILIFSTGGVLSWKIFQREELLWISSSLSAFFQLVSLVENQIILSDESFEKLGEVTLMCKEHFDRLEKLFYDFAINKTINEQVASELLLGEFKKFELSIEKIDQSIHLPTYSFLKEKAQNDLVQYTESNFSTK